MATDAEKTGLLILHLDDTAALAIVAGLLCHESDTLDYASALVTAEQRVLMAREYILTEQVKAAKVRAS